MNLFCVGISHHTADVETRERFAGHAAVDRVLREEGGLLRGASAHHLQPGRSLRCRGATNCDRADRALSAAPMEWNWWRMRSTFFIATKRFRCVQHLFRVASGLDSMVIGETEILGQAKKAYAAARESGAAGPYLHRLFQRAFRVAKQVRTRTGITRGAVSVGSVAVDLARTDFRPFRDRKVFIARRGRSERAHGARAGQTWGARHPGDESFPERAEDWPALDLRSGGADGGMGNHCREVDILISSTAAPTPIVTRENLAPLLNDRLDRPLFIIDIAVPRDVAPEVNEMEGVFLYDIDSLQSIAQQSLALRREQIAAGEEIIAGACERFQRLVRGRARTRGRRSLPCAPPKAEWAPGPDHSRVARERAGAGAGANG